MIDIIIVKYNRRDLEDKCIESVLKHTDVNYHLTIFDNYITDYPLTKLWNDLIEKSDSEYICLLNNDTLVEEGWIEKMLEVFEKEDNVGLVGPIPTRYDWSEGKMTSVKEYEVNVVNHVSFFCAVFKKSLWEKMGKLDENFPFVKQDVEFNRAVRKTGMKPMIRRDVRVAHFKHGSWEEARKKGKKI